MMNAVTKTRLLALDAKYKRNPVNKHLKVYYGWSRVNKIRKKEAISVVFENDDQREEKTMRFINKMMDVVYVRDQTDDEKRDADGAVRMFTEYSIFINEKKFQGSLELALKCNFESDKNNVSQEEREKIRRKLREHFISTHPGYNEPAVQLEFEF